MTGWSGVAHVYCAHAAGVSRQATNCIWQTIVIQPCPLLSDQIHKISQGTPPWRSGPLGLPSARLCSQIYRYQRGGPPSWRQGTEPQLDGHMQHTRETHCILPALDNRNKLDKWPSAHTTHTHTHRTVYPVLQGSTCAIVQCHMPKGSSVTSDQGIYVQVCCKGMRG